ISGLYHAALAPAAYASRLVLPPPLQGSLPAGWLAFTGRESNPQDRYKRFQIAVSSSFSGFILAQGKLHRGPLAEDAGRKPTYQACLFRLDGRRFDDRRPARDLVFHQRRQGLLTAPGLVRNFAAEAEQALLRILVIERLVERVAELVEDRLRRP